MSGGGQIERKATFAGWSGRDTELTALAQSMLAWVGEPGERERVEFVGQLKRRHGRDYETTTVTAPEDLDWSQPRRLAAARVTARRFHAQSDDAAATRDVSVHFSRTSGVELEVRGVETAWLDETTHRTAAALQPKHRGDRLWGLGRMLTVVALVLVLFTAIPWLFAGLVWVTGLFPLIGLVFVALPFLALRAAIGAGSRVNRFLFPRLTIRTAEATAFPVVPAVATVLSSGVLVYWYTALRPF